MSDNRATLILEARPQNEALARTVVAAFVAPMDPTVEAMTEIKTAVSEAVTNAVIHGYGGRGQQAQAGEIKIQMSLSEGLLLIEVSDQGAGIEDIQQAREPLYTTRQDMERAGMGFTVMETFMDSVEVQSAPGGGTTIVMTKDLRESK